VPPQIGLIELVRAWGSAGVVGVSSDEVASSAFGSERRAGLRLSGRQATLRVEVAAGLVAGAALGGARGAGELRATVVKTKRRSLRKREPLGSVDFFGARSFRICREYLISWNRSAPLRPVSS
jgi:hypothetical protein